MGVINQLITGGAPPCVVQPEISNAALALKGPDTQPETIKSRGRTSIIPKSMFQIVWNLMGFTESNGM